MLKKRFFILQIQHDFNNKNHWMIIHYYLVLPQMTEIGVRLFKDLKDTNIFCQKRTGQNLTLYSVSKKTQLTQFKASVIEENVLAMFVFDCTKYETYCTMHDKPFKRTATKCVHELRKKEN